VKSQSLELRAAYLHCRSVARARARNFYYAFLALPREKRDAICAVYAFMRTADDIADDDQRPMAERRDAMQQWMAGWKRAEAGEDTSDPAFLALRDSQRKFDIPAKWLEQLVEGTTLDISGEAPTYETAEDLYKYCYLVASVVGLVCIRIFGYEDARAEKLAEETGIAFQLTNILRDVAEDAAMGRVYLPVAELRRAGLSAETVLRRQAGDDAAVKRVLESLSAQAEVFYESAEQLAPLIHADARPALRVLVRIYHRLLRRIQARGYDVFSEKIAVPLHEKAAILAVGVGSIIRQRVFASGVD
jgi:phytoene synthase